MRRATSRRWRRPVSRSAQDQPAPSLSRQAWWQIGILGGLFLAVHYWQWPLLVHRWLYSEDWQHGLAIPLFGAYMVYSRCHDLLRAPQRGCFWGLLVMAAAALMELAGFAWLHVNYVSNVGMVLMLLGLVLYCGGPSLARVVWVPIAFWVIAMPLPPQLYQDICVKLQNIAAAGSADLMGIFGVHVEVAASTLIFNDIRAFPSSRHWKSKAPAAAFIRSWRIWPWAWSWPIWRTARSGSGCRC